MALAGVHARGMSGLQTFFAAIGGAGFLAIVFGFICKALFQNLMEKDVKLFEHTIKAANDQRLEDYKNQLEIRNRAAGVAELLSVAYSNAFTPERFNRLMWELSLWLPSKMLCELTLCLERKELKAKKPEDILILVSPDISSYIGFPVS